MKTKTIQLNKKVVNIYGEQALWQPSPDKKPQPLTYKDVFLELLPNAQRHGKEAVFCWDLAIKIKNAKDKIELTDEEVGVLKKVLEENPYNRFKSWVVAQIIKYLEDLKR